MADAMGAVLMKEEAFRQQVRKIARMYGWTLQYHTHSSIRSDKGWPDEVWGHPVRKRVLFIELKSEKGRIRPEQQQWIDMLLLAGCEAAIWRPQDMEHIKRVLGPAQVRIDCVADGRGLLPVEPEEENGWVFASEKADAGT